MDLKICFLERLHFQKKPAGVTMLGNTRIGVVIPARNESEHIANVTSTLPKFVDKVVIIDDGSTDGTASLVTQGEVIRLEGEGVGAAIDAGHKHLLQVFESDFISVVVAGDGQMDPNDMSELIKPILDCESLHVKGERLDRRTKMPILRQFGTFLLGLLTTLACGQTIRDPQCGYTATSSKVLRNWDWSKSWRGYGYPNWWLMKLSQQGYKIKHVPVKAIYSGQKSGIRLHSFMPKVAMMLLIGLHTRIIQNTLHSPSFLLGLIWITYLAGWIYSPFIFLLTHIIDRFHVYSISRVAI